MDGNIYAGPEPHIWQQDIRRSQRCPRRSGQCWHRGGDTSPSVPGRPGWRSGTFFERFLAGAYGTDRNWGPKSGCAVPGISSAAVRRIGSSGGLRCLHVHLDGGKDFRLYRKPSRPSETVYSRRCKRLGLGLIAPPSRQSGSEITRNCGQRLHARCGPIPNDLARDEYCENQRSAVVVKLLGKLDGESDRGGARGHNRTKVPEPGCAAQVPSAGAGVSRPMT
jgi:hypothetical protein